MVGQPLPTGNTPTIELYFTGTEAGTISVDTGFFPPAGYFILCDEAGMVFTPQAVIPDIEVIEGNPPPTISLPSASPQVAAGADVDFAVGASSPVGFPVDGQVGGNQVRVRAKKRFDGPGTALGRNPDRIETVLLCESACQSLFHRFVFRVPARSPGFHDDDLEPSDCLQGGEVTGSGR